MTLEHLIDRYTDPYETGYAVTVTVEHTVMVTATSQDAAIDKARDHTMNDDLRDAFERLGDDPATDLSWTADELDYEDLRHAYWEN